MNCMKCGRETAGENIFCADCLEQMDKYPIEPGTVVLLPRRKETSSLRKTAKRHIPTPEEQIEGLRKWVITLMILLGAAFIAIGIMFEPAMHYFRDEHYEIGQNYSSVAPATPNSTAPTE